MNLDKWYMGYSKEDFWDGNSDSLVMMGYVDYPNTQYSYIGVIKADSDTNYNVLMNVTDGDYYTEYRQTDTAIATNAAITGNYTTVTQKYTGLTINTENSVNQTITQFTPDTTILGGANIYMPDITATGKKFEHLVGISPDGRLFPQPLASGYDSIVEYAIAAGGYGKEDVLDVGGAGEKYTDFSTAVAAAGAGDVIELSSATFTESGTVTMPTGSTLRIYEGGLLSGTFTLVGDNTRLDAGLYQCFGSGVTITGTWVIDEVHSEWFGVTGTGNETALFRKMVNFANLSTSGKLIKVQPGTFTINAIRLYSDISFIGSGIDATIFNVVSDTGLWVKGSSGSEINVTSDILKGDTVISIASVTGLVKGDYIFISSYDSIRPDLEDDERKGELAQIYRISGTDIILSTGVSDDYTTSHNCIVKELSMIRNITIKDLTLDFSANTTNEGIGIWLDKSINPIIENVKIDGARMSGLQTMQTRGGYFNNLNIYDALMDGYGYSVQLGCGSDYNVVSNSILIHARHCIDLGQGVLTGGVNRYNHFKDITCEGSYKGSGWVLSTHLSSQRNIFENIIIRNGLVGIGTRGSQNTFINCEIYNTVKGIFQLWGDSNVYINTVIRDFRDLGIQVSGSASRLIMNGATLTSLSSSVPCIVIDSTEFGHKFRDITAYAYKFVIFANNTTSDHSFINCHFKSPNISSTYGYYFKNDNSANARFPFQNNIKIIGGSIDAHCPFYFMDYWSGVEISNVNINGRSSGYGVYSSGITKNIKINSCTFNGSWQCIYSAASSDTCYNWTIINNQFINALSFTNSRAIFAAIYKSTVNANFIDSFRTGIRPMLGYNSISGNRIINTTEDYRFDAESIGNSIYFNHYDDKSPVVYSDGGVTRIEEQFWIENNGQYLGVDTTGSFTLDVNGDINATGSYYLDSELVIDNTGDPAILLNTTAPYTSIKGALSVGASHASPDVELVISGDADISGTLSVNTIKAENFTITPKMALSAFRSQPYYYTDFLYPTVAGLNPWYGAAISSGTISETGDVDNHPGIGIIRNATGDNSGFRITTSTNALSGIFGGELSTAIVNFPILDSVAVRIGFHDATTISEPTDGIYFEMLGDSLVGKTSNVSTRSTTSSYNISIDTWYRLEIEVNNNADTAFFYVYNKAGTELWSDNLQTNIPTNRATGHGIIATKPPTGHAVIGNLLLIDYLAVYLGTLTR